jgi:hypothetical protein
MKSSGRKAFLDKLILALSPDFMYNKFCAFFAATHGPSGEMSRFLVCLTDRVHSRFLIG